MLKSVLIANRGEIARRVIRTARRLGVRTIAVYSEADAGAPHVAEADEAVLIGPAAARESYLVAEKILAAAKQTGAEAIHPGYGFLSENAAFARAVKAAGLIWVGPPPEAIDAMGLKDAAKALMIGAGVPCTPGYLGDDQSEARLAREAKAIGFPVLIKAVAGGGGKGMRKVDAEADFLEALASCRREAAASFGDDKVLLEKYVTRPRHIEVQVFGDSHGNVVHLYERDCSLQRRHQKVIEEAPAPGMDEATRAAVTAAAIKAARAVNYEGAGTVEFIADASEGLKPDRIWFMEMNTRLQVEHPVTEMITGQDLVEWQLRVASGEPLPLAQDEISIDGWAMEARLYAENPATGFLPSIGVLEQFELPETEVREFREAGEDADDDDFSDEPLSIEIDDGSEPFVDPVHDGLVARRFARRMVRLDSAVEEGGEVSPFYDPMIAKLITYAEDREAAAGLLADVCRSVKVWPVKTNAGFLARCADHPDFVVGDVDTGFIGARLEALTAREPSDEVLLSAVSERLEAFSVAEYERDVWESAPSRLFGFRLNAPQAGMRLPMKLDGRALPVDVSVSGKGQDWGWKIAINGREPVSDGILPASFGDDPVRVFGHGEAFEFDFEPAGHYGELDTASDGAVLSPMPGKVVSVSVKAGDTVAKGQTLLVLEAMKMEHALAAPFDGVVAELSAEAGGQVSEGVVLVKLDPAA